MQNNDNNGLGWVAAAITAATTVASWIVGRVKAKKAAKAAAAEAAKQNKVNAFATLDNQYTAEANATNTRALIFGAVGIIGAYLLLKDDK